MRIPHTIPIETQEVFRPSGVSLNLLGEKDRTLRAENFTWDSELPESLVTWCIRTLVSDYQNNPLLDELLDEDRDFLLETLPIDLPLTLTVPLIPDGIYWERCCTERWQTMNYVPHYDNSWKRLYLERDLQEHLETLAVAEFDLDTETAILNLCAPYVKKLNLRQLQVAKPLPMSEWGGDECWVEPPPSDHINLEPVLKLLNQLEELHIIFGIRGCALNFTWSLFKFSVNDCNNIGLGINYSQNLTVLRIHRSNLDDPRACAILKHLAKNKTLLELDFSHCKVSDNGALAVGKIITVHPTLKRINLCNNKIGPKGVSGIAYALQQPEGCPLEYLNLRLNLIRDEGVEDLCSGIAHSNRPQDLNLAGCGIEEKGIIKIGQLLQQSSTLHYLDLSNNHLGEVGGEALELGMNENYTLRVLDLRMTGIPSEKEYNISKKVKQNFDKYDGVMSKQEDILRGEMNVIASSHEG
ncbi:dynein regulatory complex subunit 5 [Anabrus simplex]|uniref:dynein regulatory complex subunit 5 n=1 Tax=Anabrus simplex TaxID=316456 RepID=UPI0034DD3173